MKRSALRNVYNSLFTVAAMIVTSLCASLGRAQQQPAGGPTVVTGSGSPNFVPIWTTNTKLGNSVVFQSGGNVGINTTTPGSPLEVGGDVKVSGANHALVFPDGS